MKTVFRGYFYNNAEENKWLWQNATFAFDTNVLLDLYRVKRASATLILEAMEFVKDRTWLPYQVAVEFLRHFDGEIQTQLSGYDKLSKFLKGLPGQLDAALNRHSMLPLDDYKEQLTAIANKLTADLDEKKKQYAQRSHYNEILERIGVVFAARVGKKPTDTELADLIKTCATRFTEDKQPGLRTYPETRVAG